MVCLVPYIVTSFINLSLYCGYVEFIGSTKTSGRTHVFLSGEEWSGETAGWRVPRPSPNLRKTEHLSTFLSGTARQAPGVYNFGLPGGECMLKMPYLLIYFFKPCAPCCTRKPGRVCYTPQSRTAWVLCRFQKSGEWNISRLNYAPAYDK